VRRTSHAGRQPRARPESDEQLQPIRTDGLGDGHDPEAEIIIQP
jgi:hypothetical protein